MRCYKCDSVLSNNDFCNSCGADVKVYKKVVRLSNAYYNMGLAKAQIRDLTGACELLRRSVRFDKKNIDARNLLGLVYFEMGEAVQAFSEWVISKNIQPDKNLAGDYIRQLQSNPVRMDTINQTIKKYNVALSYAKQGSDDLAVIQLKKVLNSNPNLIKGHLLLALLYMKKGDYVKAKKPIMKTLKIDSNNPLAKKYLEEIAENTDGNIKETETKKSGARKVEDRRDIYDYEKEQVEREIRAGYDIAIPKRKNVYRESNAGLITVINVVIGIILGVAMTFFLLIPAKEKSLNDAHNKEVLKLNSQIDTINTEKRTLQNTVEALEGEKTSLQGQLDTKGSENDQILADYEKILSAARAYVTADFVGCAETLKQMGDASRSETMNSLYVAIQPEAFKQAAQVCYNNGKNALPAANTLEAYDAVIAELNKCFGYDYMQVDYSDAAEKLGDAYEKQYKLALGTSIEMAASYKEKALKEMTDMVNMLSANPNADRKAAERIQVHINNIMAS